MEWAGKSLDVEEPDTVDCHTKQSSKGGMQCTYIDQG